MGAAPGKRFSCNMECWNKTRLSMKWKCCVHQYIVHHTTKPFLCKWCVLGIYTEFPDKLSAMSEEVHNIADAAVPVNGKEARFEG
jgi:hypothetical protein